MADGLFSPETSFPDSVSKTTYTVVARRYRPKTFDELVGQPTIVQALTTAIQTQRVGHAYLFTGARGVGKTSTARIFAKALNASSDGTGGFDLNSDIAQAIDAGEDMDVLEIDGASNRGIDEIRQLRANVAVRPSRSPYKIYIIDEVHMLTTAAFNALLKTLEEPPPHVKFIFCTTDPEKIPITVLSRCQRFDFVPVRIDQILDRLKFICRSENVVADEEALQLIARRAAGSMRDSQSLLEQILSFAAGKISVQTVHSVLGTADEGRLAEMIDAMIARDAAGLLGQLEQAVIEGIDAGQLGEQLLGYLRDIMMMAVGASPNLLRTANPSREDDLKKAAKAWGTMTLLSAIQILDESLVKMRHSTQSRILLEVAMIQICSLQDLQSLADLLRALQSGKTPPISLPDRNNPAADEKKNTLAKSEQERNEGLGQPDAINLPVSSEQTNSSESVLCLSADPLELWQKAIATLDAYLSECASTVVKINTTPSNEWRVHFPLGAEFALEICEVADNRQRIANALRQVCGREVPFQAILSNVPPKASPKAMTTTKSTDNQVKLIRKYNEHPIVKALLVTMDGQIIRVDEANQ